MMSKDSMLFKVQEYMNIQNIKLWLNENETNFKSSINQSKCKKWENWLEDKSTHIYPCVCSNREQDCIFIETYYKLDRIVKFHQKEEYFNSLVLEYKQIADDKNAVINWFMKYQNTASEIAFDTEVSIMLELEPYKNLKIKLNENEFKNIFEFQNIINELEYNQILKS